MQGHRKMFEWSGKARQLPACQLLTRHTHSLLLTRHTNTMHAPVLNVLNKSINTYPMTVLLKVVNNSMTALLEFECSIREYRFIVWNVNRTNRKKVRPWPDRLLRPCNDLF